MLARLAQTRIDPDSKGGAQIWDSGTARSSKVVELSLSFRDFSNEMLEISLLKPGGSIHVQSPLLGFVSLVLYYSIFIFYGLEKQLRSKFVTCMKDYCH